MPLALYPSQTSPIDSADEAVFFSREEYRPHVHVYSADGEAKYWLEPRLELAKNYRLSKIQLKDIEEIIRGHYDEFKAAWNSHFGG